MEVSITPSALFCRINEIKKDVASIDRTKRNEFKTAFEKLVVEN